MADKNGLFKALNFIKSRHILPIQWQRVKILLVPAKRKELVACTVMKNEQHAMHIICLKTKSQP
ncbi:hypothetical protein [Paracnuella aquatica]|uniref:hypothetical protein n=1 Tax=Paracnuella aquatica TaxID=2268757 RepID=UPI000DF00939|nr:hypothetical protein [Paracnuella aquatica]